MSYFKAEDWSDTMAAISKVPMEIIKAPAEFFAHAGVEFLGMYLQDSLPLGNGNSLAMDRFYLSMGEAFKVRSSLIIHESITNGENRAGRGA